VRAVIHACVPETIDRFYQEVGRGGRDGRASLSLVAYTEDDLELARQLNKKVSIGVDRGLQRWERMFNAKKQISDNRWSVRVDLAPGVTNLRDINMQNEQNQKWNIRTLTLMASAKIIEFDAQRPPINESLTEENDSNLDTLNDEIAFEQSAEHQSQRVIRILDENHLEESIWHEQIEPIRDNRLELGSKSFTAMKKALSGEECIAKLLSKAYAIPGRLTDLARKEVVVTRSCGGCHYCRKHNITPYAQPLPNPRPVWQNSDFPIKEPLQKLLGNDQLLLIFYNKAQRQDEWSERLEDLTRWFVNQGIRNIVDPHNLLERRLLNLNKAELPVFSFPEFEPIRMPPSPTLVIHPQNQPVSKNYLRMSANSPIRIILVPNDSLDPHSDHRLLRSSFNGKTYSFMELCTILSI
jgi:hypothetical protein